MKAKAAKLEDVKSELDAAKDELKRTKTAAESKTELTAELKELKKKTEKAADHLDEKQQELRELEEALEQAREKERKLEKKKRVLEEVRLELNQAATEKAKFAEERARFDSVKTDLAKAEDELSNLKLARAEEEEALAESRSLKAELSKEIIAFRDKRAEIEGKIAKVRELDKRHRQLQDLNAGLEERNSLLKDSSDLNWGTVHVFAKSIIRRIDDIDSMIAKNVGAGGETEDLADLRDSLMNVLNEHAIESYTYSKGTVIDLPVRKKIKVVKSHQNGKQADPPHIVETLRPGYVCSNGRLGIQTLLRKAEVSACE